MQHNNSKTGWNVKKKRHLTSWAATPVVNVSAAAGIGMHAG